MDEFAHLLRLFNSTLAGMTFGLCVLRVEWRPINQTRNARIAGLALICLGMSWVSLAHRNFTFTPWTPLITAGLILCVYGMRRPVPGEQQHRWDEERRH